MAKDLLEKNVVVNRMPISDDIIGFVASKSFIGSACEFIFCHIYIYMRSPYRSMAKELL